MQSVGSTQGLPDGFCELAIDFFRPNRIRTMRRTRWWTALCLTVLLSVAQQPVEASFAARQRGKGRPTRSRGAQQPRWWQLQKPKPQKKEAPARLSLSQAAKPLDDARAAVTEVWDGAWEQLPQPVRNAASAVKPLQVLSGFALATLVFTSTLVASGRAIGSYLAADGNGIVLERAVLFGAILENVKGAYVDNDVDIDKLFQTGVNAMLGRGPARLCRCACAAELAHHCPSASHAHPATRLPTHPSRPAARWTPTQLTKTYNKPRTCRFALPAGMAAWG